MTPAASHGRHPVTAGQWSATSPVQHSGDQFNFSPIRRNRTLASTRRQLRQTEMNMKREDIFQSKYLKAADLKGKPRIATIVMAPLETLKGLDGKETQKIVLYFQSVQKSLPLNATNFDGVCDATGCNDTDDWPGKQIELYPTKTTMGGKLVDCIRVRRPPSSRPPVVAPAPVPPAPDNEMNDEIPW